MSAHDGSFLYGLSNSNHDFTVEQSFGKNIFTNAFPVALVLFMEEELGLMPNLISANTNSDGNLGVYHSLKSLKDIIEVPLSEAYWFFESTFEGYNTYATGSANRSDVVVGDDLTGKETHAFEVKLVVAPTSGTALRPREQQSCEIVVRPATIEQMCFSIVASYGVDRRHDIGDIIAEKLINPMDYRWSSQSYMIDKLPQILDAAETIAKEGIDVQTPFVLNALWRTVGKSAVFDDECFDVFFWTDMAFMQLFTGATRRSIDDSTSEICRPARSVIWLVKSLFDYAAQGSVTFEKTHSEITYNGQTDKAGAFSGASVMSYIGCENFYHPRIPKEDYARIITPEGASLLSPERRLDGIIQTAYDAIMPLR